jgi:hypothetical protein
MLNSHGVQLQRYLILDCFENNRNIVELMNVALDQVSALPHRREFTTPSDM